MQAYDTSLLDQSRCLLFIVIELTEKLCVTLSIFQFVCALGTTQSNTPGFSNC